MALMMAVSNLRHWNSVARSTTLPARAHTGYFREAANQRMATENAALEKTETNTGLGKKTKNNARRRQASLPTHC